MSLSSARRIASNPNLNPKLNVGAQPKNEDLEIVDFLKIIKPNLNSTGFTYQAFSKQVELNSRSNPKFRYLTVKGCVEKGFIRQVGKNNKYLINENSSKRNLPATIEIESPAGLKVTATGIDVRCTVNGENYSLTASSPERPSKRSRLDNSFPMSAQASPTSPTLCALGQGSSFPTQVELDSLLNFNVDDLVGASTVSTLSGPSKEPVETFDDLGFTQKEIDNLLSLNADSASSAPVSATLPLALSQVQSPASNGYFSLAGLGASGIDPVDDNALSPTISTDDSLGHLSVMANVGPQVGDSDDDLALQLNQFLEGNSSFTAVPQVQTKPIRPLIVRLPIPQTKTDYEVFKNQYQEGSKELNALLAMEKAISECDWNSTLGEADSQGWYELKNQKLKFVTGRRGSVTDTQTLTFLKNFLNTGELFSKDVMFHKDGYLYQISANSSDSKNSLDCHVWRQVKK